MYVLGLRRMVNGVDNSVLSFPLVNSHRHSLPSQVVTLVSDGLKAWELLNGKPNSIDLILTEMELPSVSGFALLSLIAEHKACKHIPVIMMSAHDSVSIVYKCMLRGAADFLVKPLRKNELNNLWQHVWRRQPSTGNHNRPCEESEAQQKVEATAENNANSNRSSGYMDCIKRNKERIEKGTDAQSSCTRPDMAITNGGLFKEAIDLIGSFDSSPKTSYINSLNHVDQSSSMLDLSLSPVDQISDDKHTLKQSDASAFSRYISMTQQFLPCISNQQKDEETNSENPLSKHTIEYDTHSAPVGSSQQSVISQRGEVNSQTPSRNQRMFPLPVAVRGVCAVLPPIFCIQPGHQEPSSFQEKIHDTSLPEALKAETVTTEQTVNRQDLEDGGHFSSTATDHSASSTFCNNSTGSGSNGHVNLVSDANNTPQLTQREAAVNRFRMKRKERCYDKKVRYESRKKLAEQRPRVKGQFARLVQSSNTSTMEADN